MPQRLAFPSRMDLLRDRRFALLSSNPLAAFWDRMFPARAASHETTPEIAADVRAFLDTHRAQMDSWFFFVRMTVGMGLIGYLAVDAALAGRNFPVGLLFMLGYAGMNLCVRSFGSDMFRQARWIYAGLDLSFFLLLRYLFLFEALVDPNATMVGFFTLLLIAYVSYSDPRLVGVMGLVVLGATSLTLGLDTLRLSAPLPETLAYRLHPLRAFLLLSYLTAVCLVTYMLALRLRKQVLAYSVELQKRTQAAMHTAMERARCDKLEELNRLKCDFIAMLSHELRTPITPLRTSLEIVRSEMRFEKGSMEMVNIALEAAHRLQRLVQDYTHLAELLTQDKIGQERWNLRFRELLDVLLEHACREHFTLDLGDEADLVVHAEPRLLSGALLALMRRAELLTPPEARITVRAGHSDGHVVVAIHDPASYIEPGSLALDDPFMISSERTFSTSNTGLELILAQYSLRRMGGNLRVESDEADGTTVYCYLPCKRQGSPWLSPPQLRSELELAAA